MSTVLMGQCWPLQMPPSAKAVLMSLADQANDAGVCWPAVGTICKRVCLGERAVQYAIKWLCESGVLLINRTPGRSTNYQINPTSFGAGTVGLFDAPERGDNGRAGGARSAGVQQVHPASNAPRGAPNAPTPALGAPITVKNRHRTAKEKFDAAAIELPSWLDASLWKEWVQDRKDRGKPITKSGAEKQIALLAKHRAEGHTPKEVIDHSIGGGYQGLFAPTKPRNAQAQGIDPDAPWHATGLGIKAKAKEIGFPEWSDKLDSTGNVEPFPRYLARLRKAVEEREGVPA